MDMLVVYIPKPNEDGDPVPQVGVNVSGLENELQRSNTALCFLLLDPRFIFLTTLWN